MRKKANEVKGFDAKAFVAAFGELQEAKNITTDDIIEALKVSFVTAYNAKLRREYKEDAECRVEIDSEKGAIDMYQIFEVVATDDDVENDSKQICLEEAKMQGYDCKVGDTIESKIDINGLERAVALAIKQQLRQKIREAEKNAITEAFKDKINEIITGTVERVEPGYCLINVDKATAYMSDKEKIPGETYYPGQQLRVFISVVDTKTQGAQIVVSRRHKDFVRRLLEQEIMEVFDGTVIIKDIEREAGKKCKVSVYSNNPDIDAPGACIGQKGMRVQRVSEQLNKEKIDIIQYYPQQELYIAEALKPAEVLGIAKIETETGEAKYVAVVPNEDLTSAIGKGGENVRLAANITKSKIDIKKIDDALAEHIEYETMAELKAKYEIQERKVEVLKTADEEEDKPSIDILNTAKEEKITEVEEKVIEKVEVKPTEKVEEKYVSKPNPRIKSEHISVVEEEPKEEIKQEVKVDPSKPSKKAIKKEEEAKAKALEEEARKKYMPVYTEEELKAIEEEEKSDDKYDDDIDDLEDYDDYYED